MQRRSFLQSLIAGAAALTLDPEKALWVPGKKTVFIPPPPKIEEPTILEWMVCTGPLGWGPPLDVTTWGSPVRAFKHGLPQDFTPQDLEALRLMRSRSRL